MNQLVFFSLKIMTEKLQSICIWTNKLHNKDKTFVRFNIVYSIDIFVQTFTNRSFKTSIIFFDYSYFYFANSFTSLKNMI